MDRFKGKYRISSARFRNYDYGQDGAYFVTICTKDRAHFFGDVVDGEMQLSPMGRIVKREWLKTPEIRNNVVLGKFVVMPNHFHAVVMIDNNLEHPHVPVYQNTFGPQRNNLASIMRGFKGAVTKQMHLLGFAEFAWQARFHDRIIRDQAELERISEYIIMNPRNWKEDDFF